jgi:hypothetical protein
MMKKQKTRTVSCEYNRQRQGRIQGTHVTLRDGHWRRGLHLRLRWGLGYYEQWHISPSHAVASATYTSSLWGACLKAIVRRKRERDGRRRPGDSIMFTHRRRTAQGFHCLQLFTVTCSILLYFRPRLQNDHTTACLQLSARYILHGS